MGDYFVFDINDEGQMGYYYQTKANNYQGTFVPFNDEQEKQANEWCKKSEELQKEQEELIKGWIG